MVEIVHNPWLIDGKWVTQSIGLVACKRELVGIRIAKGGKYEAGPLISMVGKEEVPHRRFSKTNKQGNMKQVTKVSPGAKKNALSRLLTPTLAIVAAATALLPTNNAMADEIDLTAVGVD